MQRLDRALTELAKRGDAIGPDLMLERLARELAERPEPVVVALDERRIAVQTMERTSTGDSGHRPSWGRWLAAAVVVAVVGVVGVLVVADRGGGDEELSTAAASDVPEQATDDVAQPPASSEDTALSEQEAAVQTATAFVDAYSHHDVDLAASYLSAEALDSFGTGDWGSGVTSNGLEGLRLESQWEVMTGFQTLPGLCEVRSGSDSGTTVVCPYEYHGLRSEELGLGPYGGSYYDLRVVDGEIVSVSDYIAYLNNGFSEQVWEPFTQWVTERYPDDAAIMYTDSSYGLQRISDESNPLWEQRTREYVESGGK